MIETLLYPGRTVHLSEEDWRKAILAASERSRCHHGTVVWENLKNEAFGGAAELAIAALVLREGTENVRAAPLLSPHGQSQPDLQIGERWYEVKAVLPGRDRLAVNRDQYQRFARFQPTYIPVVFRNERNAVIGSLIPYTQVGRGKLHGNYYLIPAEED